MKALVTVSIGVQEAFEAKRSENPELNCERQHAAPLKSTYLKCYSERRLLSNLPKNTSRCKGSLMSFSHCVLPKNNTKSTAVVHDRCSRADMEVANYGTDRDPAILIVASMNTPPR